MMAEKCDQKKLIKKKSLKLQGDGERESTIIAVTKEKKICERDMGGCKLRK